MKLEICYIVAAIEGIFIGLGIVSVTENLILALLIAVLLGIGSVMKAEYLVDYDIKQTLKEGAQE